jgi:hypothetical protein
MPEDLSGQRGLVRSVAALADRLGHQLLHPGERISGLGRPAPCALRRHVGDGLQFATRMSTAQLVLR